MFQGLVYMYELFQLLRLAGQSHLASPKQPPRPTLMTDFPVKPLSGTRKDTIASTLQTICSQMHPRPAQEAF